MLLTRIASLFLIVKDENVWRALTLGLYLAAGIGQPAEADEVEDIYRYVADEMAVEKVPAPPQVYFVDNDTLQAAFQESNQAALLRWETQYGENEARRLMHRYMQGMVGLFISRSETIYVDATLPPCRQRAVLAHEFCVRFRRII